MSKMSIQSFIKFPYLETSLTNREKIVLGTIISYSSLDPYQNKCWATNESIANRIGISIRAVQQSIQSLEKKDILIREETNYGKKRKIAIKNFDLNFNFMKIYDQILSLNNLSINEKIVLSIILNYANYDEGNYFFDNGNTFICDRADLSLKSLTTIKNKLLNLGFIYKNPSFGKKIIINLNKFSELNSINNESKIKKDEIVNSQEKFVPGNFDMVKEIFASLNLQINNLNLQINNLKQNQKILEKNLSILEQKYHALFSILQNQNNINVHNDSIAQNNQDNIENTSIKINFTNKINSTKSKH